MMPEPSPPLPSVDRSVIDTTLGTTFAAAASTVPDGRTTAAGLPVLPPVSEVTVPVPSSRVATTAPMPPPIPPATRAVARTRATVRPGCRPAGGAVAVAGASSVTSGVIVSVSAPVVCAGWTYQGCW